MLGVLAGGFGAVGRYLLSGAVQRHSGDRFPVGTMVVNLLGALAVGAVAGATGPGGLLRIVGVGFLGGFTTFSTWAVETLGLAHDRRRLQAAVNLSGMLAAGVLLCTIGYSLTD